MAFFRTINIGERPKKESKQPPERYREIKVDRHNEGKNNGDVPENILNFSGPGSVVANYQAVKDESDNSNFLITVNPNVSYKLTDSQELRAELYRKLRAAMNRLGSGFHTKELLKPFPVMSQALGSTVKQYEFNIEIGNNKGFMHVHSILLLEGKAHIDVKKCTELLDAELKGYHEAGQHCYINVKAFRDQKAVINAYIHKTNPKQISN